MNLAVELTGAIVERSGQRVVQDVDLTVAPGSWFGLIGANGSGKTSLLRALAGRLPFAGGSCRIGGEELVDDRAARALRFGFSPPADKLPDALRGRDVLELVGGSIDDVSSHLGKLHEALGLAPLLDRWIGDCSAGMRQRIAIAAAFAGGYSLVILDEPFNWLDPVAIFDLREVLRGMVDCGLTLITAPHDLGMRRRSHARRWQGRTGAGQKHAADRGPKSSGARAADDRPPAIRISHVKRLAYAQKEILR